MNRELFEAMEVMDERLAQIESIAAVLASVPGDLSMATAHGTVWALQQLTEDAKVAARRLRATRR